MANISLTNRSGINGVIDTNQTVLSNMEKISLASSCFITYDIHEGRWSVIINQAGSSVKSFNDSNIIGSVSLVSSGITDLYTGVKVNYPRSDIADQIDFVQVDLSANQRFANEQENILELNLDLCNDPVQAELIASIELSQNRLDKVITFVTDFSSIDLNAGDIIDVTNSTFNFDAKLFRVISMREVDAESGQLLIEITASEYSDSIYDPDLNRFSRSNQNGIVTKGDIGTPAAPQISRLEVQSRPTVLLEATTPAGIVEGMEFWVSQTNSSTGFFLADTVRPEDGGSFGASVTVETDIDYLNSGNVWAKVRAVNSTTSGDFSPVAADTFTPVQTTDRVTNNTEIDDNGSIISTLGLSALLAAVNGLLQNQQTGPGTLFDSIFDLFQSETGVDIRDPNESIGATGPTGPVGATGPTGPTGPAGDGIDSIGDIDDVFIANPVAGQALKYDGSGWVNGLDLWQGSRKFVSSSEPASPNDGDIWFEIP